MTAVNPTWAVVATVDEPPALVQAFVAWHLSVGAKAVYLYCDNPDDPVAGMLAHLAQVHVTLCDNAHWLRLGKCRPRRHQVRQVRNARDAYARCTEDWLIHIDADEFIWPAQPVSDVLAQVDNAADGVVVRVAERIHHGEEQGDSVLQGAFRRPFPKSPRMGRRIFGPDYALTYRGLTGHSQGKAFARCGRNLVMSIHRPKAAGAADDPLLACPDVGRLELLHFEGLTPMAWVYKLARMQRALEKQGGMPPSPHRRAQADALIADPAGGLALYHRLKFADAGMRRLLEKYDLWNVPAFDPRAALATYFAGGGIDLSPEAVNTWLAERKAHLIGYLGKR